MKRFSISALLLVSAFLSTAALAGSGSVIWQIGKADHSSAEFALAGRTDDYKTKFSGGIGFEVGKGVASRDWAYIQPGPRDEVWAGSGDHPYEVLFDLNHVPEGPFAVTIGIANANPDFAPTLRVRVNDITREYPVKAGAEQIVRMYVAGGFLREGRNVLNIRVIGGSWIKYDYVSLAKWKGVPRLAENVVVKPTCLFKKHGDDLNQVVIASMELYEDQPIIKAHVESDKGWKYNPVLRNVRSGSREIDIEIPPVKEPQKLRVTLQIGRETHEASCTVQPEKQWKIYLTATSHFDYGYTRIQDEVMKGAIGSLDRAMNWCEKYPGWIWNLEAAFVAQEYLANGGRPEKLIELAKNGRIGVLGFYANELSGICSNEEISKLIGEYDLLRHKYGIESEFAMQTDVPTMVGTMPMILREHGIKYFSHGINFARANNHQQMLQAPFYWEAPDGSKVLTWKTGGYSQSNMTELGAGIGTSVASSNMNSILGRFVSRKDYPFDAILLHGSGGDNASNEESLASSVEKWNSIYEFPKLIYCRGSEFFEYIESNFAKDLTTVKGDGGAFWEDGAGSSAYQTAITRVAKEKLATAAKLTALCAPESTGDLNSKLDEAWKNALLYDEHTWGSSVSITNPEAPSTIEQWAVKKSFADKTAALADTVLPSALATFAKEITPSQNSILVFNPSSWTRSERVEFDYSGSKMTLFADSVPGLGWKLFPGGEAMPEKQQKTGSGLFIENDYYTITFDEATGAVRSIYDKQVKRELVDPSTYGLNAYLYATVAKGEIDSKPDLRIETTSKPGFERLTSPGRHIMRVTAEAPMAKAFKSEVVLYDRVKRIDFINYQDKIDNLKKEAGYFAFPFAFKNPSVRLEIPDGVITPDKDQFPGACRDWYCGQDFVSLSDDTATVVWTALDSPLLTLQDINRGLWYDSLPMANGNVFAYVFNNYWWTNYKASQSGPFTFRFSITSGAPGTDLDAKRFGESVQSPMIAMFVAGTSGGTSENSRSLVSVDGATVTLQSLEPARFANGTVLHLREMNGVSSETRVTPSGVRFSRAYECNLAEDKLRELAVRDGVVEVTCRPYGITTVLLER